MEGVLNYLNDAMASLSRAAGLSAPFSRAAQSLELASRELGIWDKIDTVIPTNDQEGKTLRVLGIKLYNITRKGVANDPAVLKLQLLGCFAMVGTGGIAADEDRLEIHSLDSMRCFSRTGLLLLGAGENLLAKLALRKCLTLVGKNPIETIRRAFGSAQEAHDCGSAYFSALCGLITVELGEYDPQQTSSGINSGVEEVLSLLRSNSEFFSTMNATALYVLRNTIDKGIQTLPISESVPLQRWMFEEWDLFAPLSVETNQNIAARLSFSLTKIQDSSGATAALERAESVTDESVSSTPGLFLKVARCAVSIITLKDELKIRDLIVHSSGKDSEASVKADDNVKALEDVVFRRFRDLCTIEITVASTQEVAFIVLDFACDLLATTGSYERTYGLLFSLLIASDAQNRFFDCVLHLLENAGSARLTWLRSEVGVKFMTEVVPTKVETERKKRLCNVLWNQLCELQTQEKWDDVFVFCNCVLALCPSSSDGSIIFRAQLSKASADLHRLLPDKQGRLDREKEILCDIETRVNQVRQNASMHKEILNAACSIELTCLARRSAIDATITTEAIQSITVSRLKEGTLQPKGLLYISSDAKSIGQTQVAMHVLQCGIDHFSNSTASPSEDDGQSLTQARTLLPMLSQALIELQIAEDQLIDASLTAINWSEWTRNINDDGGQHCSNTEELAFRTWLKSRFLSLSKTFVASALNLEQSFSVFSILTVVAHVTGDDQRDDILEAAAGYLIEAAAASVATTKSIDLPEALTLVALAGEKASSALSSLSAERKRSDSRVGIAFIYATIFMAVNEADVDDVVSDRVSAICEDANLAFPKKQGLESAALTARKLQMFKTARNLLVKVVQFELSSKQPDYDRVVRRCLSRMLIDSVDEVELREWADQVENVRRVAPLLPETLETVGIALWKQCLRLNASSLMQLALTWLENACNKSAQVMFKRELDMRAIRLALQLHQHQAAAPNHPVVAIPTTPHGDPRGESKEADEEDNQVGDDRCENSPVRSRNIVIPDLMLEEKLVPTTPTTTGKLEVPKKLFGIPEEEAVTEDEAEADESPPSSGG